MSMFKKMKERISDEVNSATNKIQNMQIIDQLAVSISQQLKTEMPEQQLPEPPHPVTSQSKLPRQQFSLIDDSTMDNFGEEEELNSEISPQHLLFNEKSIKRITSTSKMSTNDVEPCISNQHSNMVTDNRPDSPISVMNLHDLNSDIDDGIDDNDDGDPNEDYEIDLLNDSPTGHREDDSTVEKSIATINSRYKTKYRNLVHQIRSVCREFKDKEDKSEFERQQLSCQTTALRKELDELKQQLQSNNQNDGASTNLALSGQNEDSGTSSQQQSKSNAKLRDLEKLLSKCKESLKLKNAQMESLKESLAEAEKYKDYNEELKKEISELKLAQESWTVSIAENKRVMHQELEDKNIEMNKLKNEITELQGKISEGQNSLKSARSVIQDLESRVVSTSAAHQKERESLIKELNASKASALKKQQQEAEYNFQRMKLDLEKLVENLKAELLSKDELLMKGIISQQQLQDSNKTLSASLAAKECELQEALKINNQLKSEAEKEELYAESRKLEAEKNKLVEENKTLEADKQELAAKIEKLLISIKDLEVEREESHAGTRILEAEKNKLEEENQSLQTDKQELAVKVGEFQSNVKELEVKIEELYTGTRILEAEKNKLEEENKSLEDDKQELAVKIGEFQSNIKELEAKIEELYTGTKILEAEKSKLDEENKSLESHRQELVIKIEKLQVKIKELEVEREELYTGSRNLEAEKDKLEGQNQSLQADKKELAVKIEELQFGMKELEVKIEELYAGSRKLEATRDLLVAEKTKLEADLQAANERAETECQTCVKFKQEAETMRQEFDELSKKLELINSTTNSDHKEKVEILEKQIEVLSKRLAEKDSAECFPSETEFEYLKNIVHQFMLGRQPLVLARVISAVFKFDKEQVDQICRVQESIHNSSATS